MVKACDSCGDAFEARRPDARFCSDRCRKREARSPNPKVPQRQKPKPKIVALEPSDDGLVAVTRSELDAAGRLDTVLGRQALALAARIESPSETGSSVASLSKEFRAVMSEAMEGVSVKADPLDELKRRRELKRSSG